MRQNSTVNIFPLTSPSNINTTRAETAEAGTTKPEASMNANENKSQWQKIK